MDREIPEVSNSNDNLRAEKRRGYVGCLSKGDTVLVYRTSMDIQAMLTYSSSGHHSQIFYRSVTSCSEEGVALEGAAPGQGVCQDISCTREEQIGDGYKLAINRVRFMSWSFRSSAVY